ncbi:MAG: hypothetical protein AAGB51_08680 [Planctomycetota bacterium]
MQAALARARVVLWHPHGRPESPRLAESLAARGLDVVRVTDQYAAVAQVCVTHGPASSRSGSRRPVALVLVEPSLLPALDGVLAGLGLHAPNAVIWTFEESDSGPTLRAYSERKPAQAAPPAKPEVVVRPKAGLGAGGHRAASRPSAPDALDRLPGPNLRLTEDTADPVNGQPSNPVPVERPAPDHQAHTEAQAEAPEQSPAAQESGTLTDEELDMLLGGDTMGHGATGGSGSA